MDNQLKTKKYFKPKTLGGIVLVVLIFFTGFNIGRNSPGTLKSASVVDVVLGTSEQADLNLFWKVWRIIDQKSPVAKNISNKERIYGAIKGLANSLGDPYTEFFTPEEQKSFQDDLKGSFSGVGMEISIKDDVLTVISPIKNSPAAKAGIEPGDKIISIDGESTQNLSIDGAVKKIRGPVGTDVNLEIFREGQKTTLTKKITRDVVTVPNIEYSLRGDGIFVIKLYSFNDGADAHFQQAINEFAKSNSNKLIVDLRNNPGGYLDSAINIGSWFIKSGDVIVTEDYGEKRNPSVHASKGFDTLSNKKYSMVILVNKGSASASEILAGALKEYKIATIIGEKTFGKGSVQEVVKVDDETSIKITVANWLTPNGATISGSGIEPDISVKKTSSKTDTQLQKAVEFLNKK